MRQDANCSRKSWPSVYSKFSRIALKDIFVTLGHYLPLSVNVRVISSFRKGFIFAKLAKIKPSRKFPNLQYIYDPSGQDFINHQCILVFECRF